MSMAIHDQVAYKAYMMGKTPEQFQLAAQRKANATWFNLLIAGAIWYFASWPWALIPLALAALTAIQSVSATLTATKLEKLVARFQATQKPSA